MAQQFTIDAPEESSALRKIDFAYNHADSDASALELIFTVCPHWNTNPGIVEIIRLPGGVMNTLLKITKQVPGLSSDENEKNAILLRAYGNNSDVLVDRDMEATTHALLAERNLATPLLTRFSNGLLYKFLPGRPCTAHDLTVEPVWRAIAARLGEWHARLPLPYSNPQAARMVPTGAETFISSSSSPDIWSRIQQWAELHKSFSELVSTDIGANANYVLGHCDLLSANVILPSDFEAEATNSRESLKKSIMFIDYEYAIPCPAAFDIANHLSEWGGYECDYNMLPTGNIRRQFIEEYIQSYSEHRLHDSSPSFTVEDLSKDVDRYRGMPGFYWGIQALIQDVISHAEFDWLSYGEVRLKEYWAWRGEVEGTRIMEGREMPLREQRWN